METIISKLLSRYEKGSLSRRELVSGLAMLAAGGTGASAAQNELDFKDANIDHISIHVADLQRSIDFYQKMFGFSVVSRADPPRQRQNIGLHQPRQSCAHHRPLLDRDSAVQRGCGFAPCHAARRHAVTGRLCRFPHQGSRRNQRANFPDVMGAGSGHRAIPPFPCLPARNKAGRGLSFSVTAPNVTPL
jgi:catechol 2,3-dioxygenase-like lactoylglutathione lyase family enzyme